MTKDPSIEKETLLAKARQGNVVEDELRRRSYLPFHLPTSLRPHAKVILESLEATESVGSTDLLGRRWHLHRCVQLPGDRVAWVPCWVPSMVEIAEGLLRLKGDGWSDGDLGPVFMKLFTRAVYDTTFRAAVIAAHFLGGEEAVVRTIERKTDGLSA